ncbi:MAG: glycosyltransferase family 2 protein [Muribaculaceae bacterium]|nr:glycosyltransferase family 2 protein [Muribaculaceae bacterium]
MISASIVTYHTHPDDLRRILKDIEESPIDKIYIIDNSSTDELREIADEFPKARYIYSIVNVGYGKGHNVGIKRSIRKGFKYHIVINPDVYWKGDIISPILKYMEEHPDIGQLMPKVLYPNGDIQYLCKLLPHPANLLFRRFLPESLIKKMDAQYEMHWTGYNKIMEVPVLSGCFMVLRNSVLEKTGGFDDRFFMYAEDVDLCRRIGQVSKTVFFPEVSIYHEYDKGSYHSKKLLKMHIKSVIQYFNKWGWFFDSYRKRQNNYCIDSFKNNYFY